MKTSLKRMTWAVLGISAVAASVFLLPEDARGNDTFTAPPTAQTQNVDTLNSVATVQALSDTFANVVEKASPAVVYITIEKKAREIPAGRFEEGDFPQEFFGIPLPEMFRGVPQRGPRFDGPMAVGEGSGFIISKDGYILTNNHVAGDADRLKVTLSDGREFEATIVGTDPETEVALIKIEADNLPVATLGDSDKLRVGEWVLAIGSPFGLDHTVTSGIVSARGRGDVRIVEYADFIQTDAAINPGNSGGPLLNIHGEVVGMNTAIVSRSGGNDGIGFSIPINMVKYIADQLREKGSVSRGYLGVGIQPLTPELAQWFGTKESSGILVSEVVPGSPADAAGIQQDDVIVALDGKAVGDTGAFRSHIAMTPAGNDVKLTVARNGERIEKTISVGKNAKAEEAKSEEKAARETREQGKLGLQLQALTDELAKEYDYTGKTGVLVTNVAAGSPAARAGIRPGALITEVNRKPVSTVAEVQDALKENKDGTTLLRVQRGEMSQYL
ncbi:MAG TPA: DegQ family serine endoprotease, partial [Candidatus Hydrogenedentes bacterium]|nr:DegQ family serine endoprotease [Candidatus Hydrogenedentota bacterium]